MQNQPAQQPSETSPAGSAPQAPQPPEPGMTNPYNQPPKKNAGLIVTIVVIAVLLIAGGITALAISLSSGDKDNKKNNDSSQQDDNKDGDSVADDEKLREANAKTAKYMSDLEVVCEVGSVTNAAAYEKPYKVAAFSQSNERSSWSTVSLEYNAPYTVKYDEFEKVNVVACIQEQKDAAVKAKTCDFKSGGETITIDYYATTYDVAVYEAKSGKKIKDLGEVKAPATTCPMFATYNRSDPKLFAKPDSAAVDALIAKFVAE